MKINAPLQYKLPIVILLLFAYTAATAQQISSKRKQLFDFDWKFFLGDDVNAASTSFDDAQWRKLSLPHDWSIEDSTSAKNAMGNDGGYFPAGIGWYRKTFPLPANANGKRFFIYFEGVYMNAEVFINGKSLGLHHYGYTSFSYDLTPYLQFGQENVLSVRVDNSMQRNCRWYSGSGIYRHVWFITTNEIYVDQWGVSVATPVVNKQKAVVELKTTVKNETGVPQNITLSSVLLTKKFTTAAKNDLLVTLPAHSQKEISQRLTVNNPQLWDTESPNLYTAQIKIKQKNKTVDRVNQVFGIRSIKFTAAKGFELNNRVVKLNGGCVHHDNGCLGAAAYDRAETKKVELLKQAGFNAVRTSHNPPSEAFLNACDKLGLLVIDEAFDGWRTEKNKYDYAMYFDKWWQSDINAMVKRDQNHPSVIMWSIGNEIIERKEPQAVKTANMLATTVRKIDPTRPVTSAMTTWDADWEIFDSLMAQHDVAGYNYQLHHAQADHQRCPQRIILQTESYPRDAFANWALVKNNNYIIGDFVWTAMDYLGESGIGRYYYPGEPDGEHWEKNFYPWHGAYCGDIDLTGWRKPISHYRSMLYNKTEKLYMAVKEPGPKSGPIKETLWSVWPTWESWTWPGYEGNNIQVEVYAKYPSVRLYLNNILLEEKATTQAQQFKATFSMPYSPGELKAVGVINQKEQEAVVLKTATGPNKIKLSVDRPIISANEQDLAYIVVEITDKSGTPVPNAANTLKFSIEGAGTIAGIGNANLQETIPYTSLQTKTWKGRTLVVVKSIRMPGKIQLNVSGDGLEPQTLLISSE